MNEFDYTFIKKDTIGPGADVNLILGCETLNKIMTVDLMFGINTTRINVSR